MLRLSYLLSLAALAMVLSAPPSRGETIIDEWQNVKAPLSICEFAVPGTKQIFRDDRLTSVV
jgi:hypothetical protein